MDVLSNYQKGLIEHKKAQAYEDAGETDLAVFHNNAAEEFFRRAEAAGEACKGIQL